MAVDNFPVFLAGADQGLVELDAANLNYTTQKYAKKINDFKRIVVPNQPPFLITRESWALLAHGQHKDNFGIAVSWFDKSKYEVYAFVFCVAFKEVNGVKMGYFRVRTILKNINENGDGKYLPVFVETNNIAYVDLDIAIANQNNQSNLSYKQQNCLIFINADNFLTDPLLENRKDKIDDDVIKKYKDPHYNSSIIPNSLKVKDKSIVENEGSIFGKYRIWDDLLVTKYHLDKDVVIYLTWDENSKTISFDFKINNEYATGIQCPQPPVCTTHVV